MGDFNAHSTAWGCNHTGPRGCVLEDFIRDGSLCILNTGQRTHITLPSGQTSALDLSLAHSLLNFLHGRCMMSHWGVTTSLYGSSTRTDPDLGSRPPRWNLRKADWSEFQSSLEAAILARADASPMSAEDFTSAVLDSANGCIPRTSGRPKRTPVPWWTDACKNALRARKRTFKQFDRRSTTENLIAYRKAKAFARRVINEAKADSWRDYVNSLNRFTPTTQVWARIKRIAGRCNSVTLPVLKVRDRNIMHPTEVADEIGRTLSERSRSGRNGPHATRRQVRRATGTVDFSTVEHTAYKRAILPWPKLRSAIGALRDVSEGLDAIHNSMLRRLPTIAEEALLAMFNFAMGDGRLP